MKKSSEEGDKATSKKPVLLSINSNCFNIVSQNNALIKNNLFFLDLTLVAFVALSSSLRIQTLRDECRLTKVFCKGFTMVLVDTSVWVLHLREGNIGLERLLNDGEVVCHPLVVGELACGNLKNRAEILSLLKALPMATQAEHDDVMQFIDNYRLMGKGLGYLDMHLLASALLTEVPLWTLDKKLDEISAKLGIGFSKKIAR